MIKFSVVKLGGTLDAIKEIGGKVEWNKSDLHDDFDES